LHQLDQPFLSLTKSIKALKEQTSPNKLEVIAAPVTGCNVISDGITGCNVISDGQGK